MALRSNSGHTSGPVIWRQTETTRRIPGATSWGAGWFPEQLPAHLVLGIRPGVVFKAPFALGDFIDRHDFVTVVFAALQEIHVILGEAGLLVLDSTFQKTNLVSLGDALVPIIKLCQDSVELILLRFSLLSRTALVWAQLRKKLRLYWAATNPDRCSAWPPRAGRSRGNHCTG